MAVVERGCARDETHRHEARVNRAIGDGDLERDRLSYPVGGAATMDGRAIGARTAYGGRILHARPLVFGGSSA
jgi:hypothetical protein